jgi:hypothetical protein
MAVMPFDLITIQVFESRLTIMCTMVKTNVCKIRQSCQNSWQKNTPTENNLNSFSVLTLLL